MQRGRGCQGPGMPNPGVLGLSRVPPELPVTLGRCVPLGLEVDALQHDGDGTGGAEPAGSQPRPAWP